LQWGFIHSSASIGLTMKRLVQRLLGHSRGCNGEGLLYNLYEKVPRGYFNSDDAQIFFRSIWVSFWLRLQRNQRIDGEGFVDSLISLRRHAPLMIPRILICLEGPHDPRVGCGNRMSRSSSIYWTHHFFQLSCILTRQAVHHIGLEGSQYSHVGGEVIAGPFT
jgi:hypothetical protein